MFIFSSDSLRLLSWKMRGPLIRQLTEFIKQLKSMYQCLLDFLGSFVRIFNFVKCFRIHSLRIYSVTDWQIRLVLGMGYSPGMGYSQNVDNPKRWHSKMLTPQRRHQNVDRILVEMLTNCFSTKTGGDLSDCTACRILPFSTIEILTYDCLCSVVALQKIKVQIFQ